VSDIYLTDHNAFHSQPLIAPKASDFRVPPEASVSRGIVCIGGAKRRLPDRTVGLADLRVLDLIGYDIVPEPATLTLLALGALAMLRRRRKS
jgi:hypothetical protein